nr:hamartin [Helicoverpa armigera]
MLAACEAGEVFALLEGGAGGARDAADALAALYAAVREPWLTRALLAYHARTASARALDLLARAPDLHARHLLDALQDQLGADRAARAHALAALAPLVARRPPWLHRLPAHPLARALLRAARHERDALPLLHALLALAALLPAAPALATAHPAELAEALLRPAALEPAPPATRAHLQLAQLALFHALYATHPCTLLEALRAQAAELSAGAARDAWERGVTVLAESVRLHPALVTGSRLREADPTRWARSEPHDVLADCRRLSLHARAEDSAPSPLPAPAVPAAPPAAAPEPAPGSGAHAARSAGGLRPGAEPWFPLSDRCGADSAPHTPLPSEADAAEPPEAAVEATPENTPARETRAQFRFPGESGAVRAIGRRSRPASPPRKETSPVAPGEAYAARLARVAQERRAADSPVLFAGAPPPAGAVARPEPRVPGAALALEPLNGEDREVLELTSRADAEWEGGAGSGAGARVRVRDPRAAGPRGPRAAARGPPARRAASCEGRLAGGARVSVAVQTVDTWPEPYEFIIADYLRAIPDDSRRSCGESSQPSERLDAYMAELYAGRARPTADLSEQLALAHAQLMYERWRRDAHAERNRRLLGRCRQVRALELHNAALADRARAAARERDELRARPPPPAPPAPPAPAALDAQLAAERAARHRAEAALREAEALRALDAAELQRARGESFEAARHVQALARAALAAERRAEHVRRLRRELLVLAEREARLGAAARGPAPAPEDRALRAALARAEAEAEASAARADAATARAHELEAALAARDATVAELKRAARLAAEEGAARLRATRDKYAALLRVLRATEARQLERLASAELAPEAERS